MTHAQTPVPWTAPRSAMSCRTVAMSPGEDGLIGIPFPEHSSELLLRLNAQRRAGLLCDLTLTSRGARYPTHRSVMAAVSLYFRRLFGAEEGEEGAGDGAGGGCSVCQLDCVAPDALDALLEFAYTATLTIRGSGMREVLKGAQLLGIQCVADACRDILGETGGKGEGERAADPPGEGGEEEGERASSRRKRDRRHVAKVPVAASPGRPAWKQPEHGARSLVSPPPSAPGHQLHPHAAGQNGAVRGGGAGGGQEPRGTALANGGVHWQQEGTLLARPKEEGLSEEEGRGEGGAAVPTSAPLPAERGGAVGAGGVRKRKSQTPQQCPVCLKIIHGAGKLPRHMRTHTGEKPFQCSACGVRFTRNDKLKIHMRKHTGERPYPCPDCTARFLHSYDLKNHLSLHSGARPFECPLCHKAFAREDHLQRHRKGHSCLELRTRRPRRGPGGGEEPVSGAAPHLLDPLAPQQHPSSSSSSSSSGAPPPPLLYHHEGPEGLPIPLQHPSSSSSSSSSGAPPPPLLYHQEGPEGLPIPLQHPSSSSSSSSSGAPPPPLLYHQEGPEGLPIPLQALPLLAPHRLPYHGLFWRGMEVLGGGAGLEEDEDEEEEEDSRSPPHAAPPPRHARWEGEEEDEEEEGEEEEEEE